MRGLNNTAVPACEFRWEHMYLVLKQELAFGMSLSGPEAEIERIRTGIQERLPFAFLFIGSHPLNRR